MTLVTSCTACSTQFFVTQAQLTANTGKVRCGQCKHVFDASDNLIEVSLSENEINEETSNSQEFDVDVPENFIESSPIEEDHQHIDLLPLDEEFVEQTEPAFAPQSITDIYAVEPPIIESLADKVQIEHLPAKTQSAESTPFINLMISPEPAQNEPSQVEDYFASRAKLSSSGSKKMSRWLYLALIAILFPLAIAQSIYYFRTPIASQLPQVKSYLVKGCLLIGCKIEPPKQLESLAIDDSEMREDGDHDHVLQFSITLINKANVAIHYPSIELTLTDANDDTVIKRTFTPSEYLKVKQSAKINDIEAGFAAKDRLHVKLALNTKDVLVAGYRLELVE
ncbi:MAG: DUF3426 domain-containing protein [Methylophilaceae bacterium]|nr:DUF3426 domain-containing protein [Methylophilaceae bacterium]